MTRNTKTFEQSAKRNNTKLTYLFIVVPVQTSIFLLGIEMLVDSHLVLDSFILTILQSPADKPVIIRSYYVILLMSKQGRTVNASPIM